MLLIDLPTDQPYCHNSSLSLVSKHLGAVEVVIIVTIPITYYY